MKATILFIVVALVVVPVLAFWDSAVFGSLHWEKMNPVGGPVFLVIIVLPSLVATLAAFVWVVVLFMRAVRVWL